jgi:hypothetical protein
MNAATDGGVPVRQASFFAALLVLLGTLGAAPRLDGGPRSANPTADADAGAISIFSSPYTFEGVEVFGSRKYAEAGLLKIIGLPPAGTRVRVDTGEFTPQLVESKARLVAAHDFAFCSYSMATDLATKTFRVTVDLVDKGDEWRLPFSADPTASIEDPAGLIATWQRYRQTLWKVKGDSALPGTGSCRALVCYGGFDRPELAGFEDTFVKEVPSNTGALTKVLRMERDPDKRVAALMLLGYVKSREELVEILLPSLHDPEPELRNEALRALATVQKGQPSVIVPLEPVLEALWYPSLTDRNKAGWALVRIVEVEGSKRRTQILAKAGSVLNEMAGMKSKLDSLPARKVLAMLAGQTLKDDVAGD